MVRNVVGSLLALAGATAAVWCPFRAWYGGRHGSDIRVNDLFTGVGVTDHDAALLGSLFLPMGFAALLTLLGVLARSWAAVALAGCLVLGVTVLWMVRQAQFSGSLTAGGDGLDTGVGVAVASGLLLFAGPSCSRGCAARATAGPNPCRRTTSPNRRRSLRRRTRSAPSRSPPTVRRSREPPVTQGLPPGPASPALRSPLPAQARREVEPVPFAASRA